MEQKTPPLIRKLNSREARRFTEYQLIPVDAIDPDCTTRELIQKKTTHLYRYGCKSLQEATVEIEAIGLARRRRNPIFQLQGFAIHFALLSAH